MGLWQGRKKPGLSAVEPVTRRAAELWRYTRNWWEQQLRGKLRFSSLKGFVCLFLVGVSISAAIASCSPNNTSPSATSTGAASPAGKSGDIELTLVSYAVTRAAYEKIIPQFAAKWKQEHNQNVTFNQSYGGSGSQARAVIDGLEADVVALALALDTKKVEQAGLILPGWESEAANNAIVTKSVAALVTRDGNPKKIQTWADLAKDDVKVITANPKTSGGARWNFLGLWGSVTKTGGDDAKAEEFVTKVYKNVPVLPRDAREASDAFFKQGQGDVLINYENEVILAGLNGEKLPYVVPDVNISIDNPVAVVDKNVDKHGTRAVAEAFVQFLYTPQAQREFTKVGFRPVDPTVEQEVANQFPKIKTLFTAQDLGGWDEIQKKFFDDGAVFDKIQSGK
ncbi:sulfate ABC transporter substrate-binding protein [Planktothrix sp. FACHB-1355]|uniref:Sulfate ABC transporter substrate-binding protein n=1 Tax=Aerosakkonema funiforme FACHB-1375 TaxID=2949571 RepID=A0A926VHM3_9CYAN|nr:MULTISPECIES: sulfate ABC transporter substrate-binding protein [Oscillatoriales]MBD2182789.1 sulfate ABC transporter substrate-binding protein [Aerosakkonema funiforme FACHB-1375]MBD3561802.1 sulfate ABC transporter substrate-binding protein [Planktothrix sp. FACHB-1355]